MQYVYDQLDLHVIQVGDDSPLKTISVSAEDLSLLLIGQHISQMRNVALEKCLFVTLCEFVLKENIALKYITATWISHSEWEDEEERVSISLMRSPLSHSYQTQ